MALPATPAVAVAVVDLAVVVTAKAVLARGEQNMAAGANCNLD